MNRGTENGLTLIETLAAVTIVFFIVFILYSVISQSINTYGRQLTANENLNNAAAALKVMTKEIRKSAAATVDERTCTLTAGDKVFRFEAGTLYLNDTELVRGLQSFKATMGVFTEEERCSNGSSNQVSLKLVTASNQVYTAELTLRKGVRP